MNEPPWVHIEFRHFFNLLKVIYVAIIPSLSDEEITAFVSKEWDYNTCNVHGFSFVCEAQMGIIIKEISYIYCEKKTLEGRINFLNYLYKTLIIKKDKKKNLYEEEIIDTELKEDSYELLDA